jgi:hypothetical protein
LFPLNFLKSAIGNCKTEDKNSVFSYAAAKKAFYLLFQELNNSGLFRYFFIVPVLNNGFKKLKPIERKQNLRAKEKYM